MSLHCLPLGYLCVPCCVDPKEMHQEAMCSVTHEAHTSPHAHPIFLISFKSNLKCFQLGQSDWKGGNL